MTTPRRKVRARASGLKVGDPVRFSFGGRRFAGVIVEDRGPIAAGGLQLYAVRAQIDPASESMFELPADELHAA
jgi:hypothetical protein